MQCRLHIVLSFSPLSLFFFPYNLCCQGICGLKGCRHRLNSFFAVNGEGDGTMHHERRRGQAATGWRRLEPRRGGAGVPAGPVLGAQNSSHPPPPALLGWFMGSRWCFGKRVAEQPWNFPAEQFFPRTSEGSVFQSRPGCSRPSGVPKRVSCFCRSPGAKSRVEFEHQDNGAG